jgi:beta-lactamase regulating signal transducer with metallopeptidase domain
MLWWFAHNTVTASILALVVLLVCRVWTFRPSIRHALWLVVLLKLIAPPLVAWPWNPLEAMGIAKTAEPPRMVEFKEIRVVNLVEFPSKADQIATLLAESKSVPKEAIGALDGADSDQPTRFVYLQPILFSVWVVGAACMLGVQLIRAGRFRRMMRGWRPAPRRLRRQVHRLARLMKVRAPRLLLLAGLHSPFIWSLVRPWLLWPAFLDEHLSGDSHKTVIVHELAHLRRRDHWIGWLQLAGECIFWWNPLFWFVRRQIRFQAELACDAWVMRLLPEARRAYAEALIEVTALISRAPAPVPALGMSSAARQDFERRLTMIMNEKVPDKAPLIGLAAIGLIALAVLPAFAQDAKKPAESANIELNVSLGDQEKINSEAKIDLLIAELDGLVATINASHDETPNPASAPANQVRETLKLSGPDELKLTEAIELAYTEALLLKEGDDNTEKSREEKIKQIEKNLAELLKEVQSLKGGETAKPALKLNVAPKVQYSQPITVRGVLASPPKPGEPMRITGHALAAPGQHQVGNVILRVNPKEGQKAGDNNMEVIFDLEKVIAGTAAGKAATAPKQVETKAYTIQFTPEPGKAAQAYTIQLAPEAGLAKSGMIHAIAAPHAGQAKNMEITVTKSKDGQFLNINGKVIPLPKAGEPKTISLDLKSDDGQPKKATIQLVQPKEGQFELDGNVRFIEAPRIDTKVIILEGADKKELEKNLQPHVMKFITAPATKDAKAVTITGTLAKPTVDGKPMVLHVSPKIDAETKTFTYSTQIAPKVDSQAKTFIYSTQIATDAKGTKVTAPAQLKSPAAWTVVGQDAKRQTLTRTTYKLPKDKAAAVAAFLKDNVKGSVLETKVDGDSLTVTASPDVQKAIDSLLSLIQGKTAKTGGEKAQPQNFFYEVKPAPDGKNTWLNGLELKGQLLQDPLIIGTLYNRAKFEPFKEIRLDTNLITPKGVKVIDGKTNEKP